MQSPATTEGFRVSDAAVAARYLQLRSHVHDRLLARVERLANERYHLQPSKRIASTLTAHVRGGFVRGDGGEVWPVVFLTAVDIHVALCAQLTPEWLASLGTTINGPQRIRQRNWEDWWGWETSLSKVHPQFFDLAADAQDDALVAFYRDGLEWLTQHGLIARK